MCYNKNVECDSNNDCDNWGDEDGHGCKFPATSQITISGTKNVGEFPIFCFYVKTLFSRGAPTTDAFWPFQIVTKV